MEIYVDLISVSLVVGGDTFSEKKKIDRLTPLFNLQCPVKCHHQSPILPLSTETRFGEAKEHP